MAPLNARLIFFLLACALLGAAVPSSRAYENEAQRLTRLYTAERDLYMKQGLSEAERAEHYAKALQLAKDADAAELKSGSPEGGSTAVNTLVANLEEIRQIVLRDNPPPVDVKPDPKANLVNDLASQLDPHGRTTVSPTGGSLPNGGLAAQIKTDPKAALKTVDGIVGENPNDPRGLALRSSIKASLGDEAGAAADAKAALALDPKNRLAKLVAGYGAESAAASSRAGRLLKSGFESRGDQAPGGEGKAGREGKAGPGGGREAGAAGPPAQAASLEDGVKMTVISPFARQLAAGRRCLRIGDSACAVDEATAVLASDPADRDALLLRAGAYNRMGRPNEALADADSVLKANPEDVATLLERGYAKFQLGRYAEALEDVETALRLEPLNAMGHLYRGMILEKLDRASDAIGSYLRAMDLDPALKPLADEALFRLRGGTGAPPASGESRQRSNGRLALWGALGVIALGLLIKGVKRAIHPNLHTPMTPLR